MPTSILLSLQHVIPASSSTCKKSKLLEGGEGVNGGEGGEGVNGGEGVKGGTYMLEKIDKS